MISDLNTYRSAQVLVRQHGEDAPKMDVPDNWPWVDSISVVGAEGIKHAARWPEFRASGLERFSTPPLLAS